LVAPQSGFKAQSGSDEQESSPETNAPINEEIQECLAKCIEVDNTFDVFFGEKITSLRQLLKRYMHHQSYLVTPFVNNSYRINEVDFPTYRGFTAAGKHTTSTGPANIVRTTLINYLTPAFVAYRGGLRHKYIFQQDGATQGGRLMIERLTTGVTAGQQQIAAVGSSASQWASAAQTLPDLFAGGEVTDLAINPILEVETPYFSNSRFSWTKKISLLESTTYGKMMHAISIGQVNTNRITIDRYVSVGEDFQLFLFQGMPPFQVVSSFTPV